MEDKAKRKQFAEEKIIEIFMINGATDYGRTKFVPYTKDDFGSKYLMYKDINGTWHNIKTEAINFIRVHNADKFEEMLREAQETQYEEGTPASTEPINDNVLIKEDDEW